MNRSLILVAASVAALAFGATSASAQDSGFYGSVNVGSTSIEQTNGNLNPEGTIVDIRLGDVVFNYDGWDVAIEAGAAYSDAKATENGEFCIDFDCNDIGTWTDTASSKWSGALGLVVSRPVGDFVVSLGAGVRVAEITQMSEYDNMGFYENETYTDTGYAFGGYYIVKVDYPINDRWSVGLTYEHADLTVEEFSSNYGSNSSGFDQTTWAFGISRKF